MKLFLKIVIWMMASVIINALIPGLSLVQFAGLVATIVIVSELHAAINRSH